MRCGLEFNGELGFQEEELPLCATADDGSSLCPLQRQACTIPMVWEEQQQGFNTGTCSATQVLPAPNPEWYQCSLNGESDPDFGTCLTRCQEPNMVMVQVPGNPECPAGSQYSCTEMAGTPMCSPNQCIDTTTTDVEVTDESTSELTNDAVNADGECTGEYMFFPGTFTTCKLAGYSTRWDNCCNNGNKIITDAFNGPIDQAVSAYSAVSGLVDAATNVTSGVPDSVNKILLTSGFIVDPAILGSLPPPSTIDKMLTLSGAFIGGELITDSLNWLFTPCADESPQVAMIASGYCVRTGSYCSERWTFVGCVQRKETHCCFNSMLAKIMHEQGRPQLGIGWSNCDGFTPEQFQAIDFSKIDLSAYEAEIVRNSDAQINAIGADASTRAINTYN